MSLLRCLSIQFLFLGSAMVVGTVGGADSQSEHRSGIAHARQVTFELTFANRDLIWLGDPASPTASVYPKRGAHPIASDLCVSAEIEDNVSPKRRYFHEARIATEDAIRKVYAFTKQGEKLIGTVNDDRRFSANKFYQSSAELLPSWPKDASHLAYDDQRNLLYSDVSIPGPLVTESLDFLPLQLSLADGNDVAGRYTIDFAPSDDSVVANQFGVASLKLQAEQKSIVLASATVPTVFRAVDVKIGSFDNELGTYLTEAAYRAGATTNASIEPSVTVTIPGRFSSSVDADKASLVLVEVPSPAGTADQFARRRIEIDGNFDDWRNIVGVDDPRGDSVPYLEYIPDVDLLEMKVSHDDQRIYLYARVAGQVGSCHPDGGRNYFYAYMDVDRNPGTGFLPSRDDDCYFGVDLGDDCEVQFEFVNNVLRKTFYGFCGLGGDHNVLKQTVSIGKSRYGRFDSDGVERRDYKSEYIFRRGATEITEDLKLGTSDSIAVAISADGSEVEVSSTFTGFLRGPDGQPTVRLGQSIDLAVGMECDSKAYPEKSAWAADSTPTIRGYQLLSSERDR
jgi:hypothetical protein